MSLLGDVKSIFQHIVGTSAGRKAAGGTSLGDAAMGHVAEKLLEKALPDAAPDMARVREAQLSNADALAAKNSAAVAKAETAVNADNGKKMLAAQKQQDQLQARLAKVTDPTERAVVEAEIRANQAERFAESMERYGAALQRIRMNGGDITFNHDNLKALVAQGQAAQTDVRTTHVAFEFGPLEAKEGSSTSGAPASSGDAKDPAEVEVRRKKQEPTNF